MERNGENSAIKRYLPKASPTGGGAESILPKASPSGGGAERTRGGEGDVVAWSHDSSSFHDMGRNGGDGMKQKFSEVLSIINGRNQKKVENPNGKYPIYGSGGVMGYADDYLCKENTVILGRKGNINKPIFVDRKFWNVDTAFGLEARQNLLLPKYLYYFCCHYDFERHNRTVTIPSLTKKDLLEIEMEIPELTAQNHAVEVLDAIQENISNRQHVLTLLDELVKSRFVEMFGDPVTNPFGFQKILLKDVAEIKIGPFGSLLHQDDYVEGQHALVNPSHIRGDTIVPDNKLTVSEERYRELEAYHLQKYDIVLGRRGEMGRAAVVQENGLLCGTGSLLIRVKEKINPYFLQKIITYPTFKKYIESKSVGTTMQNLNAKMVSNLEIPIYPLELQNQFSTFVHQVEATKTTVRAQLAALTTLRAKMMQEFFG